MNSAISIYPNHIDDLYELKVKQTIELASKYNFKEVFTSLHLPEFSLSEQLQCLNIINEYVSRYNMKLIVDIGGNNIDELINNNYLVKYNIDYFRLDYGYNFEQIKKLYNSLNIKGFIINASMYNESQIKDKLRQLRSIDENISIRACHNFYVRPESGLDPLFAFRQASYFKKENIPVYYFVPSYSNPRGPLYVGLCTIENHRYLSIKQVLSDLYFNYDLDSFIMADEWLNENDFIEIDNTLKSFEDLDNIIEVELFEGISEEEINIVLGKHSFRYDSNSSFLRSASSRVMAEIGKDINPNHNVKRHRSFITIDNRLNKRYSGEMQIVLKDCDEDSGVNVVGKIINEDDLIKLMKYRDNTVYLFKRKGE